MSGKPPVYPNGKVPPKVESLLMPLILTISKELGREFRDKSILLTDEMSKSVTLVILGTASWSAHVALANRSILLQEPDVIEWLKFGQSNDGAKPI